MAVQGKRSMKEKLQDRQQKEQVFYRRGSSLFISNISNLKYYKTPTGANLIDIVPYTAGKNDPIEPGDIAHKLVIYLHKGLSQTGEDIICMEKTFKGTRGKCPACQEYRRRVEACMSDEETKPFKVGAWPRVLYNVYDRLKPGDGLQVWNASSFLFQQYLDVIARRSSLSQGKQPENFIGFMDPSLDGRSIGFDKQGKEELTKYIGVHFEERETEVPESILESAHVLDEIVAWPTFEQSYEEIWGVPYNGEVSEASKTASRASKFESKVKEEDIPAAVDEDVESEEEREQRMLEEKLAALKEKKEEVKTSEKKLDSKKEDKKGGTNPCSHGYVFGADIDEKPECDECKAWKDCAKEADRLEREKRK